MSIYLDNILFETDETDVMFKKNYEFIMEILKGKSEQDLTDALNYHSCRNADTHETIQTGLLFALLVEKTVSKSLFVRLNAISRDGLGGVINRVVFLVLKKWDRLTDKTKKRITWLCRELISNGLVDSDKLVNVLLRQCMSGDISPNNIFLTESMLSILDENREWLSRNTMTLRISVYSFVRLMSDHLLPLLKNLLLREVQFIKWCLDNYWLSDLIHIGRDLIRNLLMIAKIPEISIFIQGISKYKNFCAIEGNKYTGVRDSDKNFNVAVPTSETDMTTILFTPTPKFYIISRLTPEIEIKISFILNKVKFGNQKRYQDWFSDSFFLNNENQSIRTDIIRYICSVIHPTNEMLSSNLTPRWAVIGWILMTTTNNVALANAKLALFFDCYFFNQQKDSIMSIEPTVLVMINSIRQRPAMYETLLDFMLQSTVNFWKDGRNLVIKGMRDSLKYLVDMKVIMHAKMIFSSSFYQNENLVKLAKYIFNFIDFDKTLGSKSIVTETKPPEPIKKAEEPVPSELDNPANFSDDESIILVPDEKTCNLKKFELTLRFKKFIKPNIIEMLDKLKFASDCNFYKNFSMINTKVISAKSNYKWILTVVMNIVLKNKTDLYLSQIKNIAKIILCLISIDLGEFINPSLNLDKPLIIFFDFMTNFLRENANIEFIQEFYKLEKNIYQSVENTTEILNNLPSNVQTTLKIFSVLFTEIYKLNDYIGYWYLYYTFKQISTSENSHVYIFYEIYNINFNASCEMEYPYNKQTFLIASKSQKLLGVSDFLINDVENLSLSNPKLLIDLIPTLFIYYKNTCCGNTFILHSILSCINVEEFATIENCSYLGFEYFDESTIVPVLIFFYTSSVSFIEKIFIWKLFETFNFAISLVFIQDLIQIDCSLLYGNLTSYLKRQFPDIQLLKFLFTRQFTVGQDTFINIVSCAITYWCVFWKNSIFDNVLFQFATLLYQTNTKDFDQIQLFLNVLLNSSTHTKFLLHYQHNTTLSLIIKNLLDIKSDYYIAYSLLFKMFI
ncbi:hypothetical protein A3Q56_03891 [Intoshia linei]|uniref:Integrator complex subunit 3 n=1 Tax=Intoshia linei TaxID=1819745 RepID=A0A177B3R4_9BILA|nr:hypothetical protein A3Q56_03891 [Intoshia linei]